MLGATSGPRRGRGDGCGQEQSFTGFGEDSCAGMHSPFGDAGCVGPPMEHLMKFSAVAGPAGACSCEGARHSGFTREHEAPPLPLDPLFTLEITTVRVCAVDAYLLGEMLVDFLHTAATVLSLKVKHIKYSIKADVLHDGQPCCVKLRVFAQPASAAERSTGVAGGPPTELAVEAQRRAGDAVAFMGLFRKLAEHLAVRCGPAAAEGDHQKGTPASAGPPGIGCPPISCDDPDGAHPGFGPLVDMALRASALPLQLRGEIAAAFAHAAQGAQTGDALCRGEVVEALAELLRASTEDEVLFPAAEAVRRLAGLVLTPRRPQADDGAALTALAACPQAILQRLRAAPAGSNLRLELSNAFTAAVGCPQQALPASEAYALEAAVHELAPHTVDSGPSVHANATNALSTLGRRHQTAPAQPGLYS